jgi:ABC-type polar amino acid transport system ATPase subunit
VIEVKGLRKSFGPLEVLGGVDLAIHAHEVVALIGPSGSGKSTLLRCLNLLEVPDEGEMSWKGNPVDWRTMTPERVTSHRTRLGMVFQHFHLFPHRTVLENVTEGPVWVSGMTRAEAEERAMKLLADVGLEEKAGAWPSQLSGGQKQRVAIARSLAMEPDALLLDEVTSALDVEMIAGVNELLAGLARNGMTMIAVTHDLGFARRVAGRICFLEGGRILEQGTPEELLDSPKNERLVEFLRAVESV